VQKIFKKLNKIEKREMVVESQKDKISLIRDSTKILNKKRRDDEDEVIFYHNGDMSAWSGKDIYQKFIYLIKLMKLQDIIGVKTYKLLKFCLEKTSNSKIYIGKHIRQINPLIAEELEKNGGYIEYLHSWAQGLYHNISSFIHTLEQRFRMSFFCAYLKKKYGYNLNKNNWFQVVHSDDKNEVILIPLRFVKEFVKINTLLPKLFGLESSTTKDSFSFICSEMVGVQNFRGNMMDNGIKTIAQIFNKCEDKLWINNYKYIVNRATSYFIKSNDIFGAQFIESVARKRLMKITGLSKENLNLPVDFFGRNERDLISVVKYGNFSDWICKCYINKFNFENFVKILTTNSFKYKRFIPPRLRRLMKKYIDDGVVMDKEFLKLDVTEMQSIFIKMINTSLIRNKKEMIITMDNLKYIRFVRYIQSAKMSFDTEDIDIENLNEIIKNDPDHEDILKKYLEFVNNSKFIFRSGKNQSLEKNQRKEYEEEEKKT